MQANIHLGLRRRVCAYIIDFILVGVLLTLLSVLFLPFSIGALLLGFSFFSQILFWIYSVVCETSRLQATVGKWLLGMKVTDEQGQKIGFGRASLRFWAKILSAATLWWGFFMIAWTERKQGLHDKIAGTLVIKR
jgi:uncharacterized RDD family membrane protein YckC